MLLWNDHNYSRRLIIFNLTMPSKVALQSKSFLLCCSHALGRSQRLCPAGISLSSMRIQVTARVAKRPLPNACSHRFGAEKLPRPRVLGQLVLSQSGAPSGCFSFDITSSRLNEAAFCLGG